MMRGSAFVFVFVSGCLLVAPTAEAVEVLPGWDAETSWDSNVFNGADGEQDDFAIRTGPILELRQRQGDVTGRLRWRSFWEGFLDTSGADNFEHFVDLDGSWQISDRNRLAILNNLSRTDSVTAQLASDEGVALSPGEGTDVGTKSALRNRANVRFLHQLTQQMSFDASVDNSIFEFEDPNNSDAVSTRGQAQVSRTISPRSVVGLGAAFTRQDFAARQSQGLSGSSEGSGAEIIEVFGIWNYRISPTLIMSTSLGPALNRPDEFESTRLAREVPTILSPPVFLPSGTIQFPTLIDAESCPLSADGSDRVFGPGCAPATAQNLATGDTGFVPVAPESIPLVEARDLTGGSATDDTLTLFGAWSLTKTWERASARLNLQRRSSAASGNGTSTNLTLASASFSWVPEQKWRLTATAGWTLQTSASDLPISTLVFRPETVFVDGAGLIVDDPTLAVARVDGAAVTAGIRETGSSDNAFESMTYQLRLSATRQISRRLTARASASLFRSEQSGDLQSDTTTDSIRIGIGLRWMFDPFVL